MHITGNGQTQLAPPVINITGIGIVLLCPVERFFRPGIQLLFIGTFIQLPHHIIYIAGIGKFRPRPPCQFLYAGNVLIETTVPAEAACHAQQGMESSQPLHTLGLGQRHAEQEKRFPAQMGMGLKQ